MPAAGIASEVLKNLLARYLEQLADKSIEGSYNLYKHFKEYLRNKKPSELGISQQTKEIILDDLNSAKVILNSNNQVVYDPGVQLRQLAQIVRRTNTRTSLLHKASAKKFRYSDMPTGGRKRKSQAEHPGDVHIIGSDYLDKPIMNMNIPLDTMVTDINLVHMEDMPFATSAASSVQDYGDTLEYKFPNSETIQNFQHALTPDSYLPVEEIYDVDIEYLMQDIFDRTTSKEYYNYFASTSSSVANTGKVEKYDLSVTDESQYKLGSVPGSSTISKTKFEVERKLMPFFIYVVRKNQQKALGDWIQAQKIPKGATTRGDNAYLYGENYVFDDFCHTVKPMYACWFAPSSTVDSHKHNMLVAVEPTPSNKLLDVEVPESSYTFGFEWDRREFHYNRNYRNLTPTDTYANKLIIGTFGCRGFKCFRQLTLRLYHKTTEVKAETLYFQQQHLIGPGDWAGDRHIYGSDELGRQHEQLPTGNLYKGIVTCQRGRIGMFEGGKINAFDAATNVLQDTAQGEHWY